MRPALHASLLVLNLLVPAALPALHPPQAGTFAPAPFTGKVVGVKDGDTIEVLHQGRGVKVRLAHIDAPEGGQPFGNAARQRLSDRCFGRVVRVEQTGRPDRYGRLIAVIHCNGVNLNKAMVLEGYAWHFTKYSKDVSYTIAEGQARAARRGLWVDPGPVAPWNWRASRKKKK